MKILIADDERDIADAIKIILKYNGMDSDVVYNGTDAFNMAGSNVYDAIVLDIMMPGMDGIEVLQKLRSSGDTTPVLLLTAKAQVEDRIHGLNEGADDYLPKPFDKGELVARIQVMVRRRKHYDKDYITVGNTKLDIEGLEITNTDHSLRLSGKEVEILSLFMNNYEKKISSDFIIEKIWDNDSYEEGALKLYIGYLKNKLKAIQSNLSIMEEDDLYFLAERS